MEYSFCTKCGGEIVPPDKSHQEGFKCSKCSEVYYLDSKPTASAIIVNDDFSRILLAKRAVDPFKGKWDVPGGFLKQGEHPETGVKREIKEETGLDLEIIDFLGFFMDFYEAKNKSTLNIYFVGKAVGDMKAKDDVAELIWVDVNKLPSDMAFQNNIDALKCFKSWLSRTPH